MKAILLLFDSLNLRALSCYGGGRGTPQFRRLAERSVVFDGHHVGSLPCMPARRDLMTGRLNFLHRSWGPLELFDVTLTGLLRKAGIYSHLATDHYHYFENGGATYHTTFDSWDFVRGQEADPWAACVRPDLNRFREGYHPDQVEDHRGGYRLQSMLNRERIRETPDFPCVKTFDAGLDFLDRNGAADGWFLQLEAFDPHEPFHAPPEFRAGTEEGGPIRDWPLYRRVGDDDDPDGMRANYDALVALCDAQLGRLLDAMDAGGLWDDTALIVTTDHGFMLGEHDWWGKNRMPLFDEIARLPLFVHVSGQKVGRCAALSQNIDVMATLLDLFDVPPPETVTGRSLLQAMKTGRGREIALYGVFGGALNVSDGRFAYFRYPDETKAAPLFEYTLMPQHSGAPFTANELSGARLHPGFDFTAGMPVLQVPAIKGAKRPPMQGGGFDDTASVLYDRQGDPGQTQARDDPPIESRMIAAMRAEMVRHAAPPELFDRFDLGRAA